MNFYRQGEYKECHLGVNLLDDKFLILNVPEHRDFQADPGVAATRRFVAKLNHYEDFRSLKEAPATAGAGPRL